MARPQSQAAPPESPARTHDCSAAACGGPCASSLMKDDPMKRYFLGLAAASGLCASMAAAQSAAEQVIEQLTEQGYSNIQVRQTGQAVHVHALRDAVEYEYLYNAVTGEILEQETRRVGKGDDENSDSDDDGSQGGGYDRGEDGNHGHGNSDGYDDDNPGRSQERGSDEDHRRSDRGENGNRGRGNNN